MHNKNVQSEFVTADRLLSSKPCWLHGAHLVVSAGSTDSYLYDGHNTDGKLLYPLVCAAVTGHNFKPAQPIYCKQGLYVDVGTSVTGILVQWEEEVSRPPAGKGLPPREFEG